MSGLQDAVSGKAVVYQKNSPLCGEVGRLHSTPREGGDFTAHRGSYSVEAPSQKLEVWLHVEIRRMSRNRVMSICVT